MRLLAVPTSARPRRDADDRHDDAAGGSSEGAGRPVLRPAARGGRTDPRVRLVLVLLVLAAVLRGLVWVAALPPWQGPDEPSHYWYAAEVAQGALVPEDRTTFSVTAAAASSLERAAWEGYQLRDESRPHTPEQVAQLKPEPPGLEDDPASVISYPPVAYWLLAPAYLFPGLDTATERLYALRLVLVLVGAALEPLTFLLVREVVPDDRLALAAAALVSTAPLVSQMSAVVNADIVLTVLTTALALLSVRVSTRGATLRRLAGVVVLAGAVTLTKPVGPATAAIVAGTLLGVPLLLRAVRRPALVAGGWIAACVVVLALLTQLRTPVKGLDGLRFAVSYLWQFYLPPVGGMTRIARPEVFAEPVPAWPVWGKMGVGWFGWVTVQLRPWLYVLAVGSSLVASAAAAVTLGRRHRSLGPVAGRLVAASLLVVACFVLLLHALEIQYMPAAGPNQTLLQARYLLPVVPIAMVPLAAGLSLLGPRRALGGMLALLAVWTFISVAAVNTVLHFYAT